MEPEELLDEDLELLVDVEAEDWDEETLGLDLDQLDAESVAREIGVRP